MLTHCSIASIRLVVPGWIILYRLLEKFEDLFVGIVLFEKLVG